MGWPPAEKEATATTSLPSTSQTVSTDSIAVKKRSEQRNEPGPEKRVCHSPTSNSTSNSTSIPSSAAAPTTYSRTHSHGTTHCHSHSCSLSRTAPHSSTPHDTAPAQHRPALRHTRATPTRTRHRLPSRAPVPGAREAPPPSPSHRPVTPGCGSMRGQRREGRPLCRARAEALSSPYGGSVEHRQRNSRARAEALVIPCGCPAEPERRLGQILARGIPRGSDINRSESSRASAPTDPPLTPPPGPPSRAPGTAPVDHPAQRAPRRGCGRCAPRGRRTACGRRPRP